MESHRANGLLLFGKLSPPGALVTVGDGVLLAIEHLGLSVVKGFTHSCHSPGTDHS